VRFNGASTFVQEGGNERADQLDSERIGQDTQEGDLASAPGWPPEGIESRHNVGRPDKALIEWPLMRFEGHQALIQVAYVVFERWANEFCKRAGIGEGHGHALPCGWIGAMGGVTDDDSSVNTITQRVAPRQSVDMGPLAVEGHTSENRCSGNQRLRKLLIIQTQPMTRTPCFNEATDADATRVWHQQHTARHMEM